MQIPQAKTARTSAMVRIGRRAAVSLGFLAAALTALVAVAAKAGPVAAALLGGAALAAWVGAPLMDAIPSGQSNRRRTGLLARSGRRRKRLSVIAAGKRDDPRIRPGDYFSTGRTLYRVEHLAGARVLIEDCLSGERIDIDREACAALERVKRSTTAGT
jgi:hypothetical protein